MRLSYLLPILFATVIASFSSAQAQTVVVEDDFVAGPIVAPAVPLVAPYAVAPHVVVVRRPPVLAVRPVVVAPHAPLVATESVVVGPGCPYGYGYC